MRSPRRAQIIEAAIDTIAAEGLARASFARIARTSGLSSTGLISYHFANRQELLDEVARVVQGELAAFVAARTDPDDGPAAALLAFIAANVEFAGRHRDRLLAARGISSAAVDPAADGLPELIRAGQRYGDFRFFDVDVMATAIRSVCAGVLARLAVEPDLDLARHTEELVTLFELATR